MLASTARAEEVEETDLGEELTAIVVSARKHLRLRATVCRLCSDLIFSF